MSVVESYLEGFGASVVSGFVEKRIRIGFARSSCSCSSLVLLLVFR